MSAADEHDRILRGADQYTGPAIWIDDEAWDEAAIPPRPWLAKGYLLRGAVSLLAGAGAAGKSMLTLGWAVALSHGIKWGNFEPEGMLTIATYNVEDDRDEQRRRLSAVLRQHDMVPADIAGRVVRVGPNGKAQLLSFDPMTGDVQPTPAMIALIDWIQTNKPDVLIVDPLAELHTAPENDNNALRSVIAYFRRLAQDHNIAVLIIAHTRKGPSDPGNADSVRGASSIIGAVRVALTACVMAPEEAVDLGISDTQRRSYFRVDGAKSNYAPAHDAEWYERVEYTLANGENISACVPWTPPSTGIPGPVTMAAIVRDIAVGIGGVPWSPKLSGELRSVKALFERHGVSSQTSQKQTLDSLLNEHGIEVSTFRDHHENRVKGMRLGPDQPQARWSKA